MAEFTDLLNDLHIPDDRCADSKSVGWRDDSNSPSPTTSDSSSILSSSNSSVIGDDMGSPRKLISASLVTTIFLNSSTHAPNGHKKLNRSQSEPRGRSNKYGNMGGLTSSRYKTELCHPFEENGVCKYGEKCQFAHGFHELRDLARHPKYKTELCRTFHAEGYCPYGARCHFIHEERSLTKAKPSSLCLFPTAAALGCHGGSGPILSASSVKDLSMSPNSLSSLSPASSTNAFSFATGPMYSPPPSPIEARLPIFNEISAPTTLLPFGRQFGGLTA